MKQQMLRVLLILSVIMVRVSNAQLQTAELADVMPQIADHTSMFWAEGFPGTIPTAPWLRCIQTGYFAMAMNTETMQIPHFGAISSGKGYELPDGDSEEWRQLKPAKLELSITTDDTRYTCVKGGTWSKFNGPRLIASGRLLQRADITNLVFTSDSGATLNAETRFETIAWPNRLTLILGVKPDGSLPNSAIMEVTLHTDRGTLTQRKPVSEANNRPDEQWREIALTLDPTSFLPESDTSSVSVTATEIAKGTSRRVDFEAVGGWHRIDLDGIIPIVPIDKTRNQNDAIERLKIVLSNPDAKEHVARLLFAKERGGIRQPIGSSITGVSAMLRDSMGKPTGIPVQLSKNWHTKPEGGLYAGTWLHGFSQVRLPPGTTLELELTINYGHWGGVPAASHVQLCLIGWGSNQHWSQSAIGAWGESICIEPDQAQANCTITDMRPLMVNAGDDAERWKWTGNVGGGDMFRLFNSAGGRIPHSAMQTIYHRHGPCLTEVSFAGKLGPGITHASTVSLSRGDDIVRGIYRLRMDVHQPVDFSRFVIFQAGADTYNYTGERKMAIGNETGLTKEWDTQWGNNTYRTSPLECTDRVTWASLHNAVPRELERFGAWANRGFVIRTWKAQLGGKDASPWLAERGVKIGRNDSSTLDILPPPNVTGLLPGDFVETTIEHIVMPQFARYYYGPNEDLKAALKRDENTWKMIQREANGNDRQVEVTAGTLLHLWPDIRIDAIDDVASFKLHGGLAYVPVTVTGLTSNHDYILTVDGVRVDQSVHGNDFWQNDYDPATRRWSRTYNLPVSDDRVHSIHFNRSSQR